MKFNKAYTFFLRLYTEGAGSKRPLPNPWATIGKAEHDADKREGRPTTKKKQYPRPTSLETGGPTNMSEDGETDSIPRETVDEFHRELDELVHKYLGHSSDEMEGEMEEDYEENAGLEHYKKMERIAEDILNRYEDPEETPSHAITAALKKVMPNLSEREVVEATQDVFQIMYDLHGELGENGEEDAEGKIDKDRMKCNSPRRTSGGSKKFVVKACKDGKEKIVRFGDPNMKIKKSNPKRRKSFRARHKCDQKKDKFSVAYWACKSW